MKQYLLSPIAEHDIDEITTYIAEDNPTAAKKMLDSFFTAMDMLAEHPEIGHTRPDLTDKPVKFWPVKTHYLIIYKNTHPIEIVRILSGYRDIANLLY